MLVNQRNECNTIQYDLEYLFHLSYSIDYIISTWDYNIESNIAKKNMKFCKLTEINQSVINPDAALYLTILQWGTKYQIVATVNTVQVHYRLVNAKSGIVLWEGEHTIMDNSIHANENGNSVELMVSAIITKIGHSIADSSWQFSNRVNEHLFCNPYTVLLLGRRHRKYHESVDN
jgi:hypothetical protein